MKLYEKLRDQIPEFMNLPDQSLPGVPIVELYGDRRVLIEGHCGISHYGSETVRVKTPCSTLCICGRGLQMSVLSKDQLIITGTVQSISVFGG